MNLKTKFLSNWHEYVFSSVLIALAVGALTYMYFTEIAPVDHRLKDGLSGDGVYKVSDFLRDEHGVPTHVMYEKFVVVSCTRMKPDEIPTLVLANGSVSGWQKIPVGSGFKMEALGAIFLRQEKRYKSQLIGGRDELVTLRRVIGDQPGNLKAKVAYPVDLLELEEFEEKP